MRPPSKPVEKLTLECMKPQRNQSVMDEHVQNREVEFVAYNELKSTVRVTQGKDNLPYSRVKMKTYKPIEEENVIRFIVLGNAGVPNYHVGMKFEGIHAAIGDKLVSLKDNIDFVVMTGDNFLGKGVWGCDDPQWEEVWFERLRVEELGVPWFTVLGDRDMLGDASTQYNFHKCEGKERMSKYWITPSENYLLVVDETVKMFFLNTNKKISKPNMEPILTMLTRWNVGLVIGHHHIDNPVHYDGTALLRSDIIALRSRHFETYISGHDPVLKHVKEAQRSHITVGTSGGLMTCSYSDCPDAVTMDKTDGRETERMEVLNEKSYGFAVVTVQKEKMKNVVQFFKYVDNSYGSFYWDETSKQELYSP